VLVLNRDGVAQALDWVVCAHAVAGGSVSVASSISTTFASGTAWPPISIAEPGVSVNSLRSELRYLSVSVPSPRLERGDVVQVADALGVVECLSACVGAVELDDRLALLDAEQTAGLDRDAALASTGLKRLVVAPNVFIETDGSPKRALSGPYPRTFREIRCFKAREIRSSGAR
jgi:hypothetical protein